MPAISSLPVVVTAAVSTLTAIGASMKWVFDRRRNGADITVSLTTAGIAQINSQAEQLTRQDARVERLETQLAAQEVRIGNLMDRIERMQSRARDHADWDYDVSRRLLAAGITVDPPPALGDD